MPVGPGRQVAVSEDDDTQRMAGKSHMYAKDTRSLLPASPSFFAAYAPSACAAYAAAHMLRGFLYAPALPLAQERCASYHLHHRFSESRCLRDCREASRLPRHGIFQERRAQAFQQPFLQAAEAQAGQYVR